MGSETISHKIPIINVSENNMKPGSDSWMLRMKQVQHGLEEYGCFIISWDNFPVQLHNSILSSVKELFDLPKETKMRKTSDRPGGLSYAHNLPGAPRYESVGIDCPNTLQAAQKFTSVMWPHGNDTFLKTIHSYSKFVAEELYETVLRMVLESYGVERLFEWFKESSVQLFRAQKYRTRVVNETHDQDQLALRPHEDSSFMTIIQQLNVQGLQIQTKDGHWIDVTSSSPSSFVVLAGDVLMAWSNDRVRSCTHRVISKEEEVRYSTASFQFIKGVIDVPHEFVNHQHPLLYKPIDNFGYNTFFTCVSVQGKKLECPLIKAFCGI